MVSLSVEIEAASQKNTEMKSTVRSLKGTVRAKKLIADEELEGRLNDQKELLKDVREARCSGEGVAAKYNRLEAVSEDYDEGEE